MDEKIIENHTESNGNAIGIMSGILLVVFVLILFFIFGGPSLFGRTNSASNTVPEQTKSSGSSADGGKGGNVNIEVPDKIDVNVDGADDKSSN